MLDQQFMLVYQLVESGQQLISCNEINRRKFKIRISSYREVLGFTKFGSDIDPATAQLLQRGERLVEILKQPNYTPYTPELH